MGEDGLGQWTLQRHQHGGPVDGMCRQNVLADEVDVGRPESMADRLLTRQVFQSGHIIHQRVEPDVGDILLIEGQFNAP